MKNILICDDTKPKEVIGLCRKHGLGIEVQAFYHPTALSDPALVKETAGIISGLPFIAMHGPFGDLNVGSLDPMIREVSEQRIQAGYDIATDLNAKHIVFHHGRVPKTNPEEIWINRSVKFWNKFMEQAPITTHVYLENVLEEGPHTLSRILDQTANPNLHANLDIGHAHCNSKTPVLDWIVHLGSKIGYVHLHDNHGEQDEHLGFGHGTIPMKEVCHALEEYAPDATWAIEAEGEGIVQSLEWLDKHRFI